MEVPQFLDVAGHLFYSFIALGMLLLALKSKWGWVFRFMGEAGWLWLGYMMSMSSIWSWGILFICMDTYGLWLWNHKGKTENPATPVAGLLGVQSTEETVTDQGKLLKEIPAPIKPL